MSDLLASTCGDFGNLNKTVSNQRLRWHNKKTNENSRGGFLIALFDVDQLGANVSMVYSCDSMLNDGLHTARRR